MMNQKKRHPHPRHLDGPLVPYFLGLRTGLALFELFLVLFLTHSSSPPSSTHPHNHPQTLTRADLEPVLAKFRENLIEKNVAAEISDELCESVCRNLEGKTMSSFKRIRTEVKSTMEVHTAVLTGQSHISLHSFFHPM